MAIVGLPVVAVLFRDNPLKVGLRTFFPEY